MSQRSEKLHRQVAQLRADVDALQVAWLSQQHCDAVELAAAAERTRQAHRRASEAQRTARAWKLNAILTLILAALIAAVALVISAKATTTEPATLSAVISPLDNGRLPGDDTPAKEPLRLDQAHVLEGVTITHYDVCSKCCGKTDGITASGAGAVNRVIDIECKSAQAVIKDGMRISGAVKRNYGFAGRKFVERLYQPGVIDQVSERYRELFRILSDRDTTEKQAMAAAAIILADELACQWIFSGQQPLTIEQVSEFLASKAAVSAGDRGYKYLCDWVTQNSNKLCGRSENPNIEVLGALEDGRAYIIRSVFERILQDAGYSTAAMISYLKQSNLIETRGRANTKGKRINGIPTECFCLRLPAVDLDDEEDPNDLPL